MAKYSSFSPLEEQENELDGQYQKIPADSNPCRNQQKKRAGEAASAVKVSSKKRKRMEKFIEKQLKKEERGKLLAKLSKNKFESSQLLYSSKAFGKSESAREQLKRQLLEEKSGLSNISHHAQSSHSLYVHSNTEKITAEKQQQQEEEYDDMIDEEGSSNSEDEEIQESVKALPPISLINQAFGGALLKTSAADCYDTSKCHSVSSTSTSAKAAAAVVEVNAEDRSMENIASKPTISVSIPIPTFGSALKTSSSSSDNKSSLATKKVKLEHTQQQHEFHQDSSDYSSDEEENDEANNNVSNATRSLSSTATVASTIAAAGKWTSDVVSGEKYSTPTATSTPSLAIRLPTTTFRTPLLSTPAFHVPIDRPESIKAHRMNLPVVAEEQPIMEAILSNDVTILCGATGSGKTTQVPQFLYEAGFGDPKHPLFPGMVGITQPRRVAAVSMAHRVAEEMGLVLDGEEERVAAVSSSFKRKANSCVVGYQVRYDSTTVGPATRIKFMTDGILLRELSSAVTGDGIGSGGGSGAGLLLPQYSCIVLDEAHERTVGTDVLIGWLSRIVSLRNSGKVQGVLPLKIVIMSATLRVDDFTGGVPACTSPHTEEAILADGSSSVQNKDPSTTSTTGPPSSARSSQLFATPPPVIKVDGRQYKVVVHYNKRTPQVDYVSEVLRKVSKIHTTLPRGGILVFVTGQMEVQVLVRKLQSRFNSLSSGSGGSRRRHEDNKKTSRDYGKEMIDRNGDDDEEDTDTDEVEENGDDFDGMGSDSEEEDVEVMDGEEGDEEEEPLDRDIVMPLHVLPLYSMLSTEAQMKVFEPPPQGSRLCVIATNVAETSLTIPGIKYVVDCGKVKEKKFDEHKSIENFRIGWTSKASADQRAGRAGRVGPGHCYRLFSSAVFNDYFEQFQTPEILRVPIEGVVLQMKSLGIDQIVNFPFPTPPSRYGLRQAERLLSYLGAIDTTSRNLKLTEIGKIMAKFPVSPRFSKMILIAAQQTKNETILQYVIAIVAGLAVGDPFIRDDIIDAPRHEWEDEQEDSASGTKDGKIKKNDTSSSQEHEEKLKKRAAYYRVMQMFSGEFATSDAIRILNAIGAYTLEYSKSSTRADKFCEGNFIRTKAMEEIRRLRQQLTHIVKSAVLSSGDEGTTATSNFPSVIKLSMDPSIAPPSKKDLALIRQIMLSGYPDHVCRLDIDVARRFPALAGIGGKNAMPVYQSMWSEQHEVLQIHPSSAIHRTRPAPEWIVFQDIVGKEERLSADNTSLVATRNKEVTGITLLGAPLNKKPASTLQTYAQQQKPTKKLWLKGVTIVSEKWLYPLGSRMFVNQGKMLEQPEPKYDYKKDEVLVFVLPHYGPKLWDLNPTEIALANNATSPNKFMWFAKLLVEGKVRLTSNNNNSTKKSVFEAVQHLLKHKPNVLTKPYSQSQPHVFGLVGALTRRNVCSRQSLFLQWKTDPKFLLAEFLPWAPEPLHALLEKNWPFCKVNDEGLSISVNETAMVALTAFISSNSNKRH